MPFPGGTKEGFLDGERDEARQDTPVAVDVVSHRPGVAGRGEPTVAPLFWDTSGHRPAGASRALRVPQERKTVPAEAFDATLHRGLRAAR